LYARTSIDAAVIRMRARRIDEDRLWFDLMALGEITEPGQPWTRRSFTLRYDEGREWLKNRMQEAGLSVRVDAAGNLIGRREGLRPGVATIAVGSHSDTVPAGGRFDGMAGVCAGLEIARSLAEHNLPLDHAFEAIDFLAEEPSDFGLSCVGSRGLAGALTPAMLGYRHPDGRLLADAIVAAGGAPKELTKPLREDIGAYFELHIEQARSLESAGISVGIVLSIAAVSRLAIRFEGLADHAGATPFSLRADALLAAAQTIVDVRREAERIAAASNDYFVATVGKIEAEPNAPNVVPARCTIWVDIRSGKSDDASRFIAALERAASTAAFAYGAKLSTLDVISRSEPGISDPVLMQALSESARECGLATMSLASGAGHDALFVSQIAPMAMVFVPCRQGKSHCPDEWADKKDLADGTETILGAILTLDHNADRGD